MHNYYNNITFFSKSIFCLKTARTRVPSKTDEFDVFDGRDKWLIRVGYRTDLSSSAEGTVFPTGGGPQRQKFRFRILFLFLVERYFFQSVCLRTSSCLFSPQRGRVRGWRGQSWESAHVIISHSLIRFFFFKSVNLINWNKTVFIISHDSNMTNTKCKSQ